MKLFPVLHVTIFVFFFLLFLPHVSDPLQAQAQCGPRLVYNQWSCVQNQYLCINSQNPDIDIQPYIYCSTIQGSKYATQGDCERSCNPPGTCETGCPAGYKYRCEITQGSVGCTQGANSCTAVVSAIQCRWNTSGECWEDPPVNDTRDCWVGGATGTPAPGETPPPPTTPPPAQFPQTIKVIGIVFEDDNNNGKFEPSLNEKILGPQGGVQNYTYYRANQTTQVTLDCDSKANAKGQVKEAIDGPLNIKQYRGNSELGNSTMCYGGYIQMNSSGDAFVEGAVDCYKWGGSCERSADCNCVEYNGIKCVDNGNCSQPGKTNKDEMYKARSNSFYAKLKDFGLNNNYIGPAMSWSATKNQLIPVWGMYTINVDNNEQLKIRVPDTYQITRTYLISTNGGDDPLVAPDEQALIRNLGITDTVSSWDAGVANTSAVVVWGIRTKRATIRAKAHSMTNATTCNQLQTRPTVAPVDFTLTPLGTTKTQTGSNYVEWNDLAVPGAIEQYRVDAAPSASVVNEYLEGESLVCQYKPDGTIISQSSMVSATKGDQFDVDFGFKPKTLTIKARAASITEGSTCPQIRNNGVGINTTHSFTVSATDPTPVPLTQTGNGYVTFTSLVSGDYKIKMAPSSSVYVPFSWCIQKNGITTKVDSNAFEMDILGTNPSDDIVVDVGFGTDRSWVQTNGGDVTADNIKSYIPAAGTRYFSKDNAIGFPGIVTYGTSYDFNSATGSKGEARISTTGWLAQDSYPEVDYYQLYYTRFGSPTVDNYTATYAGNKPTTNGTYYSNGPLTTASAWAVTSGQQYIVFVNGNLDINYDITVATGGFLAFIVNGNITIGEDVGVRCDGTCNGPDTFDPKNVEGVYVTSLAGEFRTGVGNTASNNERLLLKGSFISKNFRLERDLGDSLNPTEPAEVFYYDPEILVFMPEAMKELPVTWQEVAP